MDNRSLLGCLVTLVLAITAAVVYRAEKENTYDKLCSPFNALMILPESNWEASVIHQRRFIIRLIEGFPNGTHISMRIVGDEEKKYEFVKDGQNLDDVGTINQLIVKSPNNVIKEKAVSNWISTSLDRNKSPKRAEKMFFIVNDKTEVDDVKKVLEVIENKERYVVLYGEHSIGDAWTWLTLDEKNIYVLGKSIMDIESTVELVKTQSCLDDFKHPELPADNQQNVNYISSIDGHSTGNTILIVFFLVCFAIYILGKKFVSKWPLHWRQRTDRQRRDESGVPESLSVLKSDFMHLLWETPTIQSRSRWPEARQKIEIDPRFQAVNIEDQKEQWFNEYIHDLLKSDFICLLRETPAIQSRSRWTELREEIKNDPRFQAVDSEDQREQWFNGYIQDLDEGGRQENGNRGPIQVQVEGDRQENEERGPIQIQAEENNEFQDDDISLRRHLMNPQFVLNP